MGRKWVGRKERWAFVITSPSKVDLGRNDKLKGLGEWQGAEPLTEARPVAGRRRHASAPVHRVGRADVPTC